MLRVAERVTLAELELGRDRYAAGAWANAYEQFSRADSCAALRAEELELLATSAYMLGRDQEYLSAMERAHHAWLGGGDSLRAARCAFWVGVNLATRGEMGPGSGWLGRAQRLVESVGRDCVEQGYLRLPVVLQQAASRDWEAASATARAAAEIGQRFGDADLFALAVQEQGGALVKQGRVKAGLALLDEAMVAVTAGELSPIVTGLVYCSVIDVCQEAYALRRAQEWTAALTRWCEQQPDLVAFTGRCLVHRAEILQLGGSWSDALAEARHARERCAQVMQQTAAAKALYRQGELYRLQGESAAAERAYREASTLGFEPQPGLALLRLALGQRDAAAAAIRRVAAETIAPLERARLLPAHMEIMVACGDLDEARAGCRELAAIAEEYQGGVLDAIVSHAQGAIAVAEGDPASALAALRRAAQAWREFEAPYEIARARVLLGLACHALGDEEAASLELEAARDAFEALGAAPDLARIDSLRQPAAARETHGLTPRELEVLRLLAAGSSNREIAAALVISEHTVSRHLQNIYAKLGLSSRTAASAFAFEHGLT